MSAEKAHFIVGIDPGQKGGIARLDMSGGNPDAICTPIIDKMPDMERIESWLDQEPHIAAVYIEKVHSMPRDGAKQAFNFGTGWGMLRGYFRGLNIPVVLVTPQRWKGKVLAGTKKDKEAAFGFVAGRFPSVQLTPPPKRSPQDGIADAMCIAEYGRREHLGEFK